MSSLEDQDTVRTADVSVRYSEENGYIPGMAFLSDDRLLVTDLISMSLKLIDTKNNKIIAYLLLQGRIELRDVVKMSDTAAAVAIPDKKIIQFISVEDNNFYTSISLGENIEVDDHCYGIDFNERKHIFAVSCKDKIEVLDRNGKCLAKWNLDEMDGKTPRALYVRFGINGNTIIVSDVNTNTVTVFSETNGIWTLLKRREFEYLRNPRGLVVLNDNRILVSCRYSNRVLLLSDTGNLLRAVVSEKNGLDSPCAIAFSVKEQKLYVSAKTFELPQEHWENLKVFELKL